VIRYPPVWSHQNLSLPLFLFLFLFLSLSLFRALSR